MENVSPSAFLPRLMAPLSDLTPSSARSALVAHAPCPLLIARALTAAGKLVLLKLLTIATGAFLVVAGILGSTAIFTGDGFVYFIGSVYTVFFGTVVLVLELKDKAAPVSAFYEWLSIYLKFLTFQRGKGLFHLGVGLLVFFIKESSCTGFVCFGIVNIAALCLIGVGALHTLRIVKEEPAALGPGDIDEGIRPAPEYTTNAPLGTPPTSTSTWGQMILEDRT